MPMKDTLLKEQLKCYLQKQANDCFTQTGRKIQILDWEGHVNSQEFQDLFGKLNIRNVGDLITYLSAGTYQTIPAVRYFWLYSDEREYPENRNAVEFYISYNDNCPYKGIKYPNGDIWVYGAHFDSKVTEDELEILMAEG
jgi:hypothetical protein